MAFCHTNSQAVTSCDLDGPVNLKTEIETYLHDSGTTRETTTYPISHFKLPTPLQPYANVQYTLLPTSETFWFMSPRPDMLEDSDEEEEEKDEIEQEEGCRNPGFTIDPLCWRLNRIGKGFLVAPKNKGGEIDAARMLQDLWVGTEDTSDIFIALG